MFLLLNRGLMVVLLNSETPCCLGINAFVVRVAAVVR